jgi:hypothetical protein
LHAYFIITRDEMSTSKFNKFITCFHIDFQTGKFFAHFSPSTNSKIILWQSM